MSGQRADRVIAFFSLDCVAFRTMCSTAQTGNTPDWEITDSSMVSPVESYLVTSLHLTD